MGCYIMLYLIVYLIVGYHCVSTNTIMYIHHHVTGPPTLVRLTGKVFSAHFDLSPSAKFLFLKFLVEYVRIIVIPYFIVCVHTTYCY